MVGMFFSNRSELRRTALIALILAIFLAFAGCSHKKLPASSESQIEGSAVSAVTVSADA